jgi:hypothetical protein
MKRHTDRKKTRSHPLLLGLGIGIASVAVATPLHATAPNVSCTSAPAISSNAQLSDDDVLQRIATLRQIGLDSLHDKLTPLPGPNQLESSCFGQATGGGGCTYSQDTGCSYTQNCGGTGGGKGTLQS